MGKEIAPPIITDTIEKFCTSIAPHLAAEYVNVSPDPSCLPNECFNNVKYKVEISGGKMQLGWSIWLWPNILIEAECHAIWITNDGEKIDITPKLENRILFLPDNDIIYDGRSIANKRMALTDSPLVDEFIHISNEIDRIKCDYPVSQKRVELPYELSKRHDEIIMMLKQKVGRNEPCPCQSGLKYKKCCGA